MQFHFFMRKISTRKTRSTDDIGDDKEGNLVQRLPIVLKASHLIRGSAREAGQDACVRTLYQDRHAICSSKSTVRCIVGGLHVPSSSQEPCYKHLYEADVEKQSTPHVLVGTMHCRTTKLCLDKHYPVVSSRFLLQQCVKPACWSWTLTHCSREHCHWSVLKAKRKSASLVVLKTLRRAPWTKHFAFDNGIKLPERKRTAQV